MSGKKGGDNKHKHLRRRPFPLPCRCNGTIPHSSPNAAWPGLHQKMPSSGNHSVHIAPTADRATANKTKVQIVSNLLTILMAIAVRRYNTVRIARWRRLVAFIKATNLLHWASTCSNIIKWNIAMLQIRRWHDWVGWLRNLLGVWHINGKPRTWQMHKNTYMGWLI